VSARYVPMQRASSLAVTSLLRVGGAARLHSVGPLGGILDKGVW
jgi:hypothetical protein